MNLLFRPRLRVPNKMQVLENQTLTFFFFPFAPRLHHRMGYFGAEVLTFSHPIHKNRPFRGQLASFIGFVHENSHICGQQTSLQLVSISGDGDITVVIHSNSTSNHNQRVVAELWQSVVIHSNSTSNHNTHSATLPLCQL